MSYYVFITRDDKPLDIEDINSLPTLFSYISIGKDEVEEQFIQIDLNNGSNCKLYFNSDEGLIEARNPDSVVIKLMIIIAESLGGRVFDDQYISYDKANPTGYIHPIDQEKLQAAEKEYEESLETQRQSSLKKSRIRLLVLLLGYIFLFLSIKHPYIGKEILSDIDSDFRYNPSDVINQKNPFIKKHPVVHVICTEDFNSDYAKFLTQRVENQLLTKVDFLSVVDTSNITPYSSSQYNAAEIVNEVISELKLDIYSYRQQTIILTNKDINLPDSKQNFRFHHGIDNPPVSIISTARLKQGSFLLRASDETLENRLIKYMKRSIGMITYHLNPSFDTKSFLYVPLNSVDDLDRMSDF